MKKKTKGVIPAVYYEKKRPYTGLPSRGRNRGVKKDRLGTLLYLFTTGAKKNKI